MYVERVLSLNNGWSILSSQKSQEWQEAIIALSMIDNHEIIEGVKQIRKAVASTKITEVINRTRATYLAFFLHTLYNDRLRNQLEWYEELPQVIIGNTAPIEPKAIKNGVSASVVGTDAMTGGDFVSNLYLDIPYYTNSGILEVSVIFIPTTKTINHFLALGAEPEEVSSIYTEEICRTQAIKFGSLTSQAPVVLAFFSPTAPAEIVIDEAIPLKVGGHTIERTIEFAPEYYQAGVELLSYFGRILRQKDPNTKAKIRIEQDGNLVHLHIEPPFGEVETITEELNKFALVIAKQIQPEDLFENRAHVIMLENKLRATEQEVKHQQDLLQLTEGLNSQRINNLQKTVDTMMTQLSTQLLHQGQLVQLATQQTNSHERIVTALIDHSQGLFKDLLHEASGNKALGEAVYSLQHSLLAGIDAVDAEDKLNQALSTIKQEKPSFLGRILTEFKGAAYKAGASTSITWVTDWIHAH